MARPGTNSHNACVGTGASRRDSYQSMASAMPPKEKEIGLKPQRIPIQQLLRTGKALITKVTFTVNRPFFNIHFVVWQFWGRAAEAS
jgi:hypothetical protein